MEFQTPTYPPSSKPIRWVTIGILILAVVAAAAWYFLIRVPEELSPAENLPTPGEQEALLKSLGAVSENPSIEAIEEDIETTDLEALDRELEALDATLQGL